MSGRVRRLLLAALLIVALVVVAMGAGDPLAAMREVSAGAGLGLLLLGLLLHLAQAWQYSIIVKALGYPVAPGESVALTALNTAANYAIPVRGGSVARAAYMKLVHGMPVPRYVAVVGSLVSVSIVIAAGAALVAGRLPSASGIPGAMSAAFGFALGSVLLAGLVVGISRGRWSGPAWWRRFGDGIDAAISAWQTDPMSLVRFVGVGVLVFVLGASKLWLAFVSVGSPISAEAAVVLQAAATVAFVVALTPGNLGIREGLVVAVAVGMGFDVDVALAAALVDRAAEIIVTLFLAGGFARHVVARSGTRPTRAT